MLAIAFLGLITAIALDPNLMQSLNIILTYYNLIYNRSTQPVRYTHYSSLTIVTVDVNPVEVNVPTIGDDLKYGPPVDFLALPDTACGDIYGIEPDTLPPALVP